MPMPTTRVDSNLPGIAPEPWSQLSSEDLPVALRMKAHDEDLTDPKSRCPERATSTENYLGQLVIRRALGEVEFEQFLALGHPHLLGLSGMGEGFFAVDLHLIGDDEFRLLDLSGSQELLGTGAAGSRLAVVIPLDLGGHGASG